MASPLLARRDNEFVEYAYETVSDARVSGGRYLAFYNGRRPPSSLGGGAPDQAYFRPLPFRAVALLWQTLHLHNRHRSAVGLWNPEGTANTGKRDLKFVRRGVESEGSRGGYGHQSCGSRSRTLLRSILLYQS